MVPVCYEPLWNSCCLLTWSLSLHFQFENKFCIVWYNMKKKQLWQACGPKLLSGKSSLLRALLLELWNVLGLKTISSWDLGHAAAVLSPCSCKNWLRQAEHNRVCSFAMGLLKVMQCHQAWCWGKRRLWTAKTCNNQKTPTKPILEVSGKGLSYSMGINLWWHGLLRSLLVIDSSSNMLF